MYFKKISLALLFVILSSCSSYNPFKENKFYYKNGYQRVQLDIENESIRKISQNTKDICEFLVDKLSDKDLKNLLKVTLKNR